MGYDAQQRGCRMTKRMRFVVSSIYAYSALHILGWYVFLTGSHDESWSPVLNAVFACLFLPLNVLAGGICRLVWGSLNIFEARCVVNLIVDGAVASLISASLIAGAAVWLSRPRKAPT